MLPTMLRYNPRLQQAPAMKMAPPAQQRQGQEIPLELQKEIDSFKRLCQEALQGELLDAELEELLSSIDKYILDPKLCKEVRADIQNFVVTYGCTKNWQLM